MKSTPTMMRSSFCLFFLCVRRFFFRPCCAKATKRVFTRALELVKVAQSSAGGLQTQLDDSEKRNEQLKEMVGGLRRDLDREKSAVLELQRNLEQQKAIVAAQQAQLAECSKKTFVVGEHGLLSKCLMSLVFLRSPNICIFPDSLQQVAITCQQKWNVLYPTHNLSSTESGGFIYGEPTFMAMTRICHVIKSELACLQKPLQPNDVFLDWGCGAGKWLCFAQQLLGVLRLVVLGIEIEQTMFEICKKNVSDVCCANILHAASQSLSNFCPARIVVNYDGGPQAMQNTAKGRIHQTIMRTAFSSPTVDVVVSTRLNWDAFWAYFTDHWHHLGGSLWKCIYIRNCGFGGSRFTTNVWFRLTPMQRNNTYTIDKQMHKLLTGFFFLQF